jgi:hypothetical protein
MAADWRRSDKADPQHRLEHGGIGSALKYHQNLG